MRYLTILAALLALPAAASSIYDPAISNVQTFNATVSSCARGSTTGVSMTKQAIPSPVDGNSVAFSIFEPSKIDCTKKHPLLITSHGWSDSRIKDPSKVAAYTSRGYVVISLDQRGHGDSDGTKHILSPSFEVQDNIAVLDWAEANLDYLEYRNGNLLLGSFGASYGGGFQLALNALDPKARLDAMVPTVTWFDLGEALAPNGVTRDSWVSQLLISGDLSSNVGAELGQWDKVANSGGLDETARQVFTNLSATGRSDAFTEGYLTARSFSYFCGDVSPKLPYTFDAPSPLDNLKPAPGFGAARGIPTFVIGAAQDSIFPMKHNVAIQNCMRSRGAPAYYVAAMAAHHEIPSIVSTYTAGAGLPSLDATYDINFAGDEIATPKTCGAVSMASIADFFDQYLRNKGTVFSTAMKNRAVCMAPSTAPSRAMWFDSVPRATFNGDHTFTLPATTVSTADLALYMESGPVAAYPLATATSAFDIFGIPALNIDVVPTDIPAAFSDLVLYAGLATKRDGKFRLINNQNVPIRGTGHHELLLAGVSETIAAGDTLYLAVFAYHPSMGIAASSRNILTPKVTITPTVALPIYNGAYVRPGAQPTVASRTTP